MFILTVLFLQDTSAEDCSATTLSGNNLVISSDCTGPAITSSSNSNSITINNSITYTGQITNETGASLSILNNGDHINPDNERYIRNYGILGITNNGVIGSSSDAAADYVIDNQADGSLGETITSITNTGSILGDNSAIRNYGSSSIISNITNSGTISSRIYGIFNNGTITNISNTGTISSGVYGILNSGTSTITSLINSQSGLTYSGNLPSNYNVIIGESGASGKTTFSNSTGTLDFDIDSTSNVESLISNKNYDDVIKGLDSSKISSLSGSFTKNDKTFSWNLHNTETSTDWDLIVGDCTGSACDLDNGEDIIYGVKSIDSSTQNWGSIAPSSEVFTVINQLPHSGLGWPLGDIGSQPDPINGYVFTRQTNVGTSSADILAIKKVDGTTKWLGVTANDVVMGYDTKKDLLILRRSADSVNKILSYNMTTSETSTISSSFAAGNINWQAGGNNAIDSYGRIAYTFRGTTLYKINIDDGTEESITLDNAPVAITWDSKGQKLYGINNTDIISINTTTGAYTVLASDVVDSLSNYVQFTAPKDQRYYIQQSGGTKVYSLSDGSLLGSFDSVLRIMPPGAVVLGGSSTDESSAIDIADPTSQIIKLGSNSVTYTGENNSSGGVSVVEGTLKVESGTQLGSGELTLEGGEIEISADATLSNTISASDNSSFDTDSNTITLSGTVKGNSKITKKGTGTLSVTGTLLNTEGFDVSSGELKINNSSGSSPAIVSGGTLSGAGIVRNLTVNSGTVAPGNSIGTLTVVGDTILNSNSVLVIEVDSSGNADKIESSGSVTIDGRLRISPSSGSYSNGQNYTILSGSSISGTFSDITILSCSGTASASYGTTSVTITLSNCYSTSSENRDKIISYINDLSASGDLSTFTTSLNNLSGTSYNNAIETLDYHAFGATQTLIKDNFEDNHLRLISHLSNLNNSNKGWWSDFSGSTGHKRALSNYSIPGYDHNTIGTTIGYTSGTIEKLQGLSFNYLRGAIKLDKNEGSSDLESFSLSMFKKAPAFTNFDAIYSATLSITNVESTRHIKLETLNRLANSDYDIYSLDAALSLSKYSLNFYDKKYTFNMHSGITLSHSESFEETGANSLSLKVDDIDTSNLRLGFDVSTNFESYKSFTPSATVGYMLSRYLDDTKFSQSFINKPSFVTKYDRNSNNNGYIKVSLKSNQYSSFELDFDSTLKVSNKGSNIGINFNLLKRF